MREPISIHDLHTECPACGDEAYWQGEIEKREDGIWAVVVCPNGHGHFPVKKPAWQGFLQKHVTSGGDGTYAKITTALLQADAAQTLEALVSAYRLLAEDRATPLSFFRVRRLPLAELQQAAGSAGKLPQPLDALIASLLLGYAHFVPAVPLLDRGLEAATLAVSLPSQDVAHTMGAWLGPGGVGESVRKSVLTRLIDVLGEAPSPGAVDAARKLLSTLRIRGAAADADDAAATWKRSLPGLSF